jgi:protein involved in polysaccharide export with SLBB domain
VLRRIAILGEVREPSLYMVDPTVALTHALALAGGIGPAGNSSDIRLVRDGQVLVQGLDSNGILGETQIQSGDQIVVGQQGWVKQNLTLITAGIGAVTSIIVAMILVGGR